MKIRGILTALAGVGMVLAVTPATAGAAKASAKVMMTGDCFDGQMLEGTDEDNCQIMVSVTPKNKNVNAVLEVSWDEQDPEWEELDSGRTRGGRLVFDISSTDEDDVWMDGVVLYRVKVKKAPGVSIPKVREYKVEYVSAENVDEEDTQMTEDEKAEEAEMDAAMADNKSKIQEQQPNAAIFQQKGEAINQGQMQQCQQMEQKGQPAPSGTTAQMPKCGPQGGQGDFDKAGVFNRACGSIGFPKDKCDQLVQVKSPKEALTILGDQAEKWCNAVASAVDKKVSCDMVLPNVFPPLGK